MRQTQYGSLYVLMAACAATGRALGLISPVLNVGVVNIFLEQSSREWKADGKSTMIKKTIRGDRKGELEWRPPKP